MHEMSVPDLVVEGKFQRHCFFGEFRGRGQFSHGKNDMRQPDGHMKAHMNCPANRIPLQYRCCDARNCLCNKTLAAISVDRNISQGNAIRSPQC